MNDDIDVPIIKVHEGHPCLFHTNLWNANFAWLLLSNHDPWSLYGGNTLCCNPTFFEKLPHSTTVCMPPCGLCGWQVIWWQLDVRMGMPRLPLIITYVFFTCYLSSVSSLQTQSCLGCNWIFWFACGAPHHNHPDYLHPTMGAHLLCLESITHQDFQFGLEGFELLLPSMVQGLPFFLTNF